MSDPEMDSAENPWFVNCCNVGIQIALMVNPISTFIWFWMAVFDCHDSWW